MAWSAAILMILDGPLNFRDFHVMAPGAPATRIWIDIWRDSVMAERQTKGFGSNGTGNAERSQDVFDVSSSLAIQKSIRTPTARRKCRPTHSERQRRRYLLHSPQRPPQIDVSRSLAYASHVLENTKSPTFLESIDDRPAHVQPHRLQTVASPYVKRLAPLL
ncbi:hypothetical protein BKA70DRAFT_346641 [Coprinopsis sp. MPI-PUGE-AT-0042]|nr:hypothetical protein BKA70DRAFT_346641 [Coprinopsis sp. MPI-PUGE-AT-0042]